ncbi:STAS domain-containing protein [Methyloprofundus sp.]|uniref:STAS domain-containing protein n=1 Tax=Methyloprofundus sp. TaxID=2020875 RepID=UPI003D0C4019
MEYKTTNVDNTIIITLTGEIDLQTSPQARELILKTLKNKQHVLVEMSAVEYIDSSGMASLVEGFQNAKVRELYFGLVNISEATRQVLALAHLDKIFPIFDTVDDGLAIVNMSASE